MIRRRSRVAGGYAPESWPKRTQLQVHLAQRLFARLLRVHRETLEIRSGDPLSRTFASFGARSRIFPPWLIIHNPAAVSIGDDVHISQLVAIEPYMPPGRVGVHIGNRVMIGWGTRLVAYNGIEIGDDCAIGSAVNIVDSAHRWPEADDYTETHAIWQGPLTSGAGLRIERGAWIQDHCSIRNSGITIGAGAIVAANSVVTRDVEPETMVAGIPARRVPFDPVRPSSRPPG